MITNKSLKTHIFFIFVSFSMHAMEKRPDHYFSQPRISPSSKAKSKKSPPVCNINRADLLKKIKNRKARGSNPVSLTQEAILIKACASLFTLYVSYSMLNQSKIGDSIFDQDPKKVCALFYLFWAGMLGAIWAA